MNNSGGFHLNDYRTLTAGILAITVISSGGCGQTAPDDSTTQQALTFTVNLAPCVYTTSDPYLTSDDVVCVCDGQGLSGNCQELVGLTGLMKDDASIAVYPNGNSFGKVGNDKIRSMITGAHVRTHICTDAGYTGICNDVRPSSTLNVLYQQTKSPGQSTSDLTNTGYDMDISSIRIDRTTGGLWDQTVRMFNATAQTDCRNQNFTLLPGFFAVYTDGNYGYPGGNGGYSGDCTLLGNGPYGSVTGTPSPQTSFGLHNDWLSSIRISNQSINIYNNINFGSLCTTATTSMSVLGGCNDLASALSN